MTLPKPLTPAQVELLEQWLTDRQARVTADVEAKIAAAIQPVADQLAALIAQVATLQEALAVLDGAALKVGDPLALQMASGKYLCAQDGGPTTDEDPVELVARSTVGQWESFIAIRGAD